jgi:hypothetical protein
MAGISENQSGRIILKSIRCFFALSMEKLNKNVKKHPIAYCPLPIAYCLLPNFFSNNFPHIPKIIRTLYKNHRFCDG